MLDGLEALMDLQRLDGFHLFRLVAVALHILHDAVAKCEAGPVPLEHSSASRAGFATVLLLSRLEILLFLPPPNTTNPPPPLPLLCCPDLCCGLGLPRFSLLVLMPTRKRMLAA